MEFDHHSLMCEINVRIAFCPNMSIRIHLYSGTSFMWQVATWMPLEQLILTLATRISVDYRHDDDYYSLYT